MGEDQGPNPVLPAQVEFAAGAGHLGLLLAHLFPRVDVVVVDRKQSAPLTAGAGGTKVSAYRCSGWTFTGQQEEQCTRLGCRWPEHFFY